MTVETACNIHKRWEFQHFGIFHDCKNKNKLQTITDQRSKCLSTKLWYWRRSRKYILYIRVDGHEPSDSRSVCEKFFVSPEHHAEDRFLDVLVAVDRGRQRSAQLLKHILRTTHEWQDGGSRPNWRKCMIFFSLIFFFFSHWRMAIG